MHYRHFTAVASCAAALAFATTTPSAHAATQWTSLKVGTLNSYSLQYASLPDGRFVLGTNGAVQIQTTFGTAGQTQVANGGSVTFDPSFVAIDSAGTSGLIGGGGFNATSGMYGFNPSSPSTSLLSTPLATLQNYCAVYYPVTGHLGWLIGGLNGTNGKHNITFVSADGQHTGSVTGELCTYSSGIALDAGGNFYAALYETAGSANEADADKVLKFTASQIDAAVAAVIAGTPAPLAKADGALVFQFDSAGSIAVDSQGRLWATGYKVDYLQAYDPAHSAARIFIPDQPALKHAQGAPAYQLQTFAHSGVKYVGFLANDSFYNFGSDLVYGYDKESDLVVRSVSFAHASQSAPETAGTVNVVVNINPPPTAAVTVPLTYGGIAVRNKNYTAPASVVFPVGSTSQNIAIKVINDAIDEAVDNTVVIKLGTPSPAAQAGLASAATSTCTLTITDDDVKPVIAAVQNFGPIQVGSLYHYQVATTTLGSAAVTFTASGLPPGLSISPSTGMISGHPLQPGEYDQVWITATSSAGKSVTAGYVITVADFAAAAHGAFVGYVDRDAATSNGQGARFDIAVGTTAAFTGKLTLGTAVFPLSGLLDTSVSPPTGTATFTRARNSYPVTFTIDPTTGALAGTVGSAAIHGWPAQKTSTLTGPHNFFANVITITAAGNPQGTSFGTTTVAANAVASTTIRTADGTVFATTAPLGPNGEVLVYQTGYSQTGTLLGSLTIASDAPQTVGGSLTWSRPDSWSSPLPLTVHGGKYHPASGSGIVMSLAAGNGNATLAGQGGGLAAPVSFHVTLSAPSVAYILSPSSLLINNSTGAFNGSFKYVSGHTSMLVPFLGLIVPDTTTADPFDGAGEGFFLMPGTGSVVSRSGVISLTATTN